MSEYLVERMIAGGVDKLCFVISPGKTDILQYYGARFASADIVYVVQPAPGSRCDAVFRAAPIISPSEPVVIGLPDTIWFPSDALARLPGNKLSLLLFPVDHPELFDSVSFDVHGNVQSIHVKQRNAPSPWIWEAIKMSGLLFHNLLHVWRRPERGDGFLGTLINAWLQEGGSAVGIRAGRQYVDTGTLHGYRAAIHLLENADAAHPLSSPRREQIQSGEQDNSAHEIAIASTETLPDLPDRKDRIRAVGGRSRS